MRGVLRRRMQVIRVEERVVAQQLGRILTQFANMLLQRLLTRGKLYLGEIRPGMQLRVHLGDTHRVHIAAEHGGDHCFLLEVANGRYRREQQYTFHSDHEQHQKHTDSCSKIHI